MLIYRGFQYLIFRLVAALAAGGVVAVMPGFIELKFGQWLRAGGTLAVFAIVYFMNPAVQFANSGLASSVPKRIDILEALPLTAVGKIFKPALQQREVTRVVRQEVERMCLKDIEVEVIQHEQRGLVACIRAGRNQESLALLLGRYSLQVEWLK